jgi:hypothetical protein
METIQELLDRLELEATCELEVRGADSGGMEIGKFELLTTPIYCN